MVVYIYIYIYIYISGWWFGTFLTFPDIGNVILPTDELHHFSEGWLNHQPVYYLPNQLNLIKSLLG